MGNFSSVTEMNKTRPFKFRPGNRAGVFIWENVQPGYRDHGHKNRDLGIRASPPSQHMNTSKFLQKEREVRRVSETETAWLTGLT